MDARGLLLILAILAAIAVLPAGVAYLEYHHGWESESIEEASERAMIVVQDFVDDPDYWRCDGSAEAQGPWNFIRKPRSWPYR